MSIPKEDERTPDTDLHVRGRIAWLVSDEDGPPDCGVTLGLGGGHLLQIGEISKELWERHGGDAMGLGDDCGQWIVLFGPTRDQTRIIGRAIADADADAILTLLKSLTIDQPPSSFTSLREALAPFAKAANRYDDPPGIVTHSNVQLWQDGRRIDFLTVGDLRRARAALNGVTQPAKPMEIAMTEAQIKHMVDRFLNWKLPENFNPDGGISFKKTFNEHTPYPSKSEPYGTNLFNFDEATAMVRHMLESLPSTEVEKLSTDTEVRE